MKSRWLSWAWILLGIVVLAGWWWGQRRLERSQDQNIRSAAQRYRVEPALVKAIVWRESRFNVKARGHSGEIGLMQLREEAAQEWADAENINDFLHENCFDPRTNILAGTWYLSKLLKRYLSTDNPVPYALADYNAGRGNVLKWISGEGMTNSGIFIEQIRFPMTKDYVRSVMRRQERYAAMRKKAGP
jgi:soluble lytic murein transglycosylase